MPIKADRLEVLHDVLLYCSTQDPHVFTVFERICINQERGALFSQLNQESEEKEIRYYQCPPELESKIQQTFKKANNLNLKSN